MLILLSPSKTQEFDTPAPTCAFSEPALLESSQILVRQLRKLTKPAIARLMGISDKLAALNHGRYRDFKTPFTLKNAKQALFAFQGDVYDGLDAQSMNAAALEFAQEHIRILSGLYGVLKPLDLIQPYRLEMKTRLSTPHGKDLYAFWGDSIAQTLRNELEQRETRIIINLASEEYFKAVPTTTLHARIITPQFKEKKGSAYKMIGLFAKNARGRMAHYIAQRGITHPEALQFFAEDGYRLNVALSKLDAPVYTRG